MSRKITISSINSDISDNSSDCDVSDNSGDSDIYNNHSNSDDSNKLSHSESDNDDEQFNKKCKPKSTKVIKTNTKKQIKSTKPIKPVKTINSKLTKTNLNKRVNHNAVKNSDSDNLCVSNTESEITEEKVEKLKATGEYDRTDFRNVLFENLKGTDKYAYGKLGMISVIIMKKNGYVNVGKLCIETNKLFHDWNILKSSKELKEIISSYKGIPVDELIIKNMADVYESRGSYAHPSLIIHIASWCNRHYAALVSDIMIKYHTDQAVAERDRILMQKDDTINALRNEVRKLLENGQTQIKKIDRQTKKINKLERQNTELLSDTKHIINQNKKIKNTVEIIADRRVVDGKPQDSYVLSVVENIPPTKKCHVCKKVNNKRCKNVNCINNKSRIKQRYSAFRVMYKSYTQRLDKHEIKYGKMNILHELDTPNSTNLWNRIKTELGGTKIDVKGCHFNLIGDYTKEDLIKDIIRIHNERLDYTDI